MGNTSSLDTETANELYVKESAKKGLRAVSAASASILLSPVVILALPFIGAYEFSTVLEEELMTGYKVVDGIIGGLLGVVASPIAPLYCFFASMKEIFSMRTKQQKLNRSYMRKAHGMLRLNEDAYNIAVTGCPGTGKSSILNALLGYKDNHAKAAAVGEVETTVEPKSYKHPLLPTLYLWDMPGVGTPRHPANNYFENYFLGAFDAILVVFDDRLMASDVDIARRANSYNVPVFFVKNKADLAIERKLQRYGNSRNITTESWAAAVSDLTGEIRDTIYRNMQKFGLDTNQLYIVSAHTMNDFIRRLRDHCFTSSERLIHEKILITNLLDTIADRRNERVIEDDSDTSSIIFI